MESKNTLGAGIRWLNKFETPLEESLISPESVTLCNNQTFYNLQLRCINFNDWVIAFSIHNDSVLIEAILHTSRLTD